MAGRVARVMCEASPGRRNSPVLLSFAIWHHMCQKIDFSKNPGLTLAGEAKVDGRSLRGERNRQALLDAAMELLKEGNYAPSAQEIAERAGVALRGIFRHFGGMEGLYGAVEEKVMESGQAIFTEVNSEGTFRERLLNVVEQRASVYEKHRNALLATQVQRWRSPYIKKTYARSQRQLRVNLEEWLPECRSLSAQRIEAVHANASFETWHRLRDHQNLSVDEAVDTVYETLKLLITQP